MCYGIAETFSVASIVATVASAAASAYGQYSSAQAQSAAAAYGAQVARNNQIVAQQNADLVLKQGQAQETAQRQKTANLIGATRAAFGARGIQLDSGSAADVQASEAITGELDALTIRSNAQLQARNFLNQSNNFSGQAGLLDAQGRWAESAGMIGAGSSILGGVSAGSDRWLRAYDSGLFGGGAGRNTNSDNWQVPVFPTYPS